jgi:hypothetical protein
MIGFLAQRQRLSNRRCHEVIQFEHGGFIYIAGIDRFDNGRPAEVFLPSPKPAPRWKQKLVMPQSSRRWLPNMGHATSRSDEIRFN